MKNKNSLIIILIICILFVPSVSALDIASCSKSIPGAIIDEKIPNAISTIITVIKIVIPVLLVIFGMLDLMKSIVAQKEDEIKKGQQIFIKRLISGVLVFLVFTIVQFVIGFFAGDKDKNNIMTCAQCFINGKCTYNAQNGKCPKGMIFNDSKTACIEK